MEAAGNSAINRLTDVNQRVYKTACVSGFAMDSH